jgi:CheY-like chemotaxis protein
MQGVTMGGAATRPSVPPRVLVVEDYEATRQVLVHVLEQQGFSAVPVANGADAMEYLSHGGPADVILLDVVMPVMDGWSFRRAQQRDPWLADIPVIVFSALDGHPISGLKAAATFQKPVNLAALLRTIHRICSPA